MQSGQSARLPHPHGDVNAPNVTTGQTPDLRALFRCPERLVDCSTLRLESTRQVACLVAAKPAQSQM